MIKIEKIYSEPELFEPIEFDYGLNIIMGEKSETSNKKIGVGKSLCIEFINFCLLKKFSESRISLIPKNDIDQSTVIFLELLFGDDRLTICRSIGHHEKVTIFKNAQEIAFEKIEDASEFLSNLYFKAYPADIARISFRSLLSPLVRDERSEFKDIIKCFDTSKNIPRDYRPHLFFLDLSVSVYNRIAQLITELDKKKSYLSEVRKLLTNNNEIKVSNAKAHINGLENEVKKINSSIEKLNSNESFDSIQSELASLESELKTVRNKQQLIKTEIKQIESLPQPELISENELTVLFNQFKEGLGDIVSKSIEEVKQFKDKIDSFRNTLVNSRLSTLKAELFTLNARGRELDSLYSKNVNLLDDGSLLSDLKTAINIFNHKNSELSRLKSLVSEFDTTERLVKLLELEKSIELSDFDALINEHELLIKSFSDTILSIHERIMGNREAYFEIKTNKNKEFINFVLRTDDDGSHTTERIKVFIYDIALMLNSYTKKNHPQFLIHDNLFDKDDETLGRSLNYVYNQDKSSPHEFQYILTLNQDLVESVVKSGGLDFNINEFKRASFTKDSRFLKYIAKYTEVTKRK
jgi:uncharacterized protein YydD (DUF2326 family)